MARCGLVTLDEEKAPVAASGAERQAKADGQAGFLSFLAVTKPWGQVQVGSK